jgi:uncharacterized protein (DUF2147 family)
MSYYFRVLYRPLLLACLVLPSLASAASVEGTWQTIDDETEQPKSVVRLWQEGGELKGQIVEILKPAKKANRCTECSGERKNQPIEGMVFIWGMKKEGDAWEGGRILDPNNGKEYKAIIRLSNNGRNLDVRGFIGFSLIGRTQNWNRID